MSKSAKDAKVDSLVYESFKPQKPGKIVSVRPSRRAGDSDYLTVKFEDGTTKEFSRDHLNDFEELIDEHKRKYLKFDAIAQRLKVL